METSEPPEKSKMACSGGIESRTISQAKNTNSNVAVYWQKNCDLPGTRSGLLRMIKFSITKSKGRQAQFPRGLRGLALDELDALRQRVTAEMEAERANRLGGP